jgi:nitrate/TMAO reductase-like tetraheme cytochrome c subunit
LKRLIEDFFEHNKTAIILLLLAVSVSGAILGSRYYRQTQDDPQFCATCHLMKEAFDSWERSRHRDIKCQICHRMTILEQNRLLVSFVVKGKTGPEKQAHGKLAPWKSCRDCHFAEAEQGSVSMRKSYGHAKHVFMENIGCENCHTGELHNFEPQEKACSRCHSDKLVHGLGMEGLSCLKCHTYGEKTPKMVSTKRCEECHKNVRPTGPMAHFACFDCHKPHGKIKLSSGDCLGECHGNESKVGQHGLHMRKTRLECLDCHKAHKWVIGMAEARGLCNRCHPFKDPKTFIY